MFSQFVDNLRTALSIFGDKAISRSSSEESRFSRRRSELSEVDISKIFSKSNIIQRMVETIPSLALECEIKINSDSEDKIDKEKLQKRFRDWNIKQLFFDATVSARMYKEAYLVLDINDGVKSSLPINWKSCKGLIDISFIEFGGIDVNWNEGDTERLSYTIRKDDGNKIEIHPERILVFSGKRITPKLQSYNAGSHLSQIESSIESYNSYVQSLNEGNNLLQRMVTFVFEMGGLRDYLISDPLNGIRNVQQRLQEHKSSIGGIGGLCIDKDSEAVNWVTYSLSGVPDIINKSKEFFIANTELTHDMLMNEGSHDTASLLEDKNTQRKIKSFVRDNWIENLNTVLQVITCEFYTPEYDILFTFELPEQSLTQLETVTAKNTQAQTDNIYYTMGILNQETLQESRFASSNPWEINLINPGVFPEPVDPSVQNNSNKATSNAQTKKKTEKKTDSKFTDAITAEPIDYQVTSQNLEEILQRLQDRNHLVFAFVEADETNDNNES